MIRFVALSIVAGLLASGATAKPAQSTEQAMHNALHAMRSAIVSQSSSNQAASQSSQASSKAKKGDPDQGDDHASDVAILKVCNHDNPSAQRSAICPQPNSPN